MKEVKLISVLMPQHVWKEIKNISLTATQAGAVLGMSRSSMLRTDIPPERTQGGHRRYSLGVILKLLNSIEGNELIV